MRLPPDGEPGDQRPLPQLSQEDGAFWRGGQENLRLPLRLPGKEEHFRERKKESKGGASKQDVRRYLANQNKQEPAGQSAFAAALQAALEKGKD